MEFIKFIQPKFSMRNYNSSYKLHGVIPKNLIWKFQPLIHEGSIFSLAKFNLSMKKLNPSACKL
ncbi:hypothetical protein MKX01_030547 [Papaver californicum]|nr:hypothetical protein MKX01_030547 [Papaver californicum]